MKSVLVTAGACSLLMLLCGCSSDIREALINHTVVSLNESAGSLKNIKENVDKWSQEKKDTDKAALLKKAGDSTNTLVKAAKELQRVKQQTLQLNPASKEERDDYLAKYREQISAAVQSVKKAQDGLNQALLRAEEANPQQKTALTELKQKLQLAQSEFEVLTKQQQ